MIFTKGLRRVRLLVAVAAVVLSTLPLVAREQAGALEGTDFAGAMPDCGSVNVDGKGGIGWSSKWHLTTSRPAGSIVHPGDEWIVTFKVVSKPGSTPIGNDGPDPINLGMAFQGPVAKVSQSAGYDRLNFNFGPKEVGPAGFGGVSSWSFDANSGPTVQKSDGVNATYQATVRATAAGVVTLAGLAVNGHDPTPPAGQFQCTIPVDLKWTVVQLAAPVSGLDNVRTDARYALVLADDASNGNHAIEIDVLANDDDPNNAGGPGDLSEVRISAWSPASTKGGSVRCGTDAQQDAAADAVFLALADGPCRYTPPQDFSGNDSFTYRLRGAGGVEKQVVVSVQVVGNQAPKSSPPALGSTVNQAESFDLKPYILDLEGDPYTCALAVGPAHGQLVVAPDCTAEWTPDAGYSGQDSFAVQICDEHPHLAGSLGSVPTVRAPLYDQGNPNDLTETSTRRCSNLQGTILVSDVLIFPPQGLPDADVVDAGYPVDGIGDYAVEIPILDNDVDIDGPQPGDPAWNGTVQIIEHDEALGAAAVVGDLLTFTPAEGVVGDVVIRYAVCEDPSQQDNPYVDDPNTLPNEGLPFCGVGTVVITVVGNEAPLAVDDPVALAAGELVQGIDLAANDVDPEGGVLSCVPGPLDLQPAGLAQATVDAACQLQVQAQPGVVGQATAPYTVCDDHVLSVPAYPAAPYGTDGRDPGDPAPRCAQALVIVDVAEVAPPPEDPDATCQQDCVEEDPPADDGDGDGGDDGGDDVLGGGYGRPGGQVGRSSWASTGSRGSLPRTGGPAAAPALVGAGLLAAGAVVLVVRRRVASVARRS